MYSGYHTLLWTRVKGIYYHGTTAKGYRSIISGFFFSHHQQPFTLIHSASMHGKPVFSFILMPVQKCILIFKNWKLDFILSKITWLRFKCLRIQPNCFWWLSKLRILSVRHFKEHFRIVHKHFSPGISMTHHIRSRQVKTYLPSSRNRPYIILTLDTLGFLLHPSDV